MSGTGHVPLPCHGQQPDYLCAWCTAGVPVHSPTAAELDLVATLNSPRGVGWARVNGVHPGTDELGRIVERLGV